MSMIIEVQHIPVEGKTLTYVRQAGELPVLRELAERGECRFVGPLTIVLTVVPERTLIKVSGSIEAVIEQSCSRCLNDYRSDLQQRFTLRFSRDTAEHDEREEKEKELELTEEHIGLTIFKGEAIDFTDSVQEQVVLALPYKPLCREDCKGLCPRCGIDLNVAQCGCAQGSKSSPFDVLKARAWPTDKQRKG